MFNRKNLKGKGVAYSLSLAVVSMGVGFSSCNTSKGVGLGAAGAGVGAAVGGIIGSNNGSTGKGAVLGAVIGGAAGAAIGVYMDKQAKEIEEDIEGAKIERVGEGINIVFDSGLLFDVGESTLTPATRANLDELAVTLNKYEDTKIGVAGHTDATGSDEFNQKLSIKRAEAVANYLKRDGVDGSRMTIEGYGESQPVASNETEAGRQANRRVVMTIVANEKLKKAAENGEDITPAE